MDDRCKRCLKDLPTRPCQLGKNDVDKNADLEADTCPWGVNDIEANYCMWVWLKQNPGKNTATKVAQMLNISTQRVGQIYHRALSNLKDQAEILEEFYNDSSE